MEAPIGRRRAGLPRGKAGAALASGAGLALLLVLLAGGGLYRAYRDYVARCPYPAAPRELFAESLLLRTLWRGGRVEVPLEAAPRGSATLVTRGGPRRHFWLVHDDRGLIAFRSTVAHSSLRDEDVELLATWSGAAWEVRRLGAIEYFFNHPYGAFDREGRSVAGPASRDLDRFPVHEAGRVVVVDTSNAMRGACRMTEGCDCYP